MYVQLLVYAAVAIAAWYVFFKPDQKKRKGKPLPGPTGLPIIGYAHKLYGAPVHELLSELAKTYGGIFHLKSLGANVIVLNDADILRSIFCDEQYKRFTNDRAYHFWMELVTFQSKGIFGTRDAINSPHGELRKNFVRGMHVYGDGIPAFEETVQSELLKFNEQLEGFNGKEFDMQPLIKNFLYSVVSIFVSGQPIHDDATRQIFWDFDNCSDYLIRPDINIIFSTMPSLRFVPGPYKRAFDNMIRARDALLKKYFYDAKRTFKPGQTRGLVDFYLNEQRLTNAESCSDERVCAVALEVLFAGVITTLSHLSAFFLCMLDHPEYQTKIQEEIDRLLTNMWGIHHDEEIWGDPWTFRPERWITDDGALLPNDHVLRKKFVAFGTGRRQCVGESLARSRAFLFVTSLLQRWTFEPVPGHTQSSDPRDGGYTFHAVCIPIPYRCRAVPRKI